MLLAVATFDNQFRLLKVLVLPKGRVWFSEPDLSSKRPFFLLRPRTVKALLPLTGARGRKKFHFTPKRISFLEGLDNLTRRQVVVTVLLDPGAIAKNG